MAVVPVVICDECEAEGIPGAPSTTMEIFGWVIGSPWLPDLCPACVGRTRRTE